MMTINEIVMRPPECVPLGNRVSDQNVVSEMREGIERMDI